MSFPVGPPWGLSGLQGFEGEADPPRRTLRVREWPQLPLSSAAAQTQVPTGARCSSELVGGPSMAGWTECPGGGRLSGQGGFTTAQLTEYCSLWGRAGGRLGSAGHQVNGREDPLKQASGRLRTLPRNRCPSCWEAFLSGGPPTLFTDSSMNDHQRLSFLVFPCDGQGGLRWVATRGPEHPGLELWPLHPRQAHGLDHITSSC